MTKEQPQLFLVPVPTLTKVVNFLGELPFRDVAPLMMMIDQTVKLQEKKRGTVQRSKSERQGSEPQSER